MNYSRLFVFMLVLSVVMTSGQKVSDNKMMIVWNEDNDHYFKLDSTLMTKKALEGYIDRIAETKVTHFFMCPNGQRTSYDSQVDEPIWMGMDEDPVRHSWCINCGILYRNGIDPYQVWISRCRKKGISPWITVRMNDGHGLSSVHKNYRTTKYWLEHPELRRVPEAVCDNRWGTSQKMLFDYSKPEAYRHHLDLVRELLNRYDTDGIELDWMRNPYLLSPGKEQEQSGILTQFMRDVRDMADSCQLARGHYIAVSVRVPTRPEVTDAWGFKVAQWAEEGLIDILVPTSFYESIDMDIPVEEWRELLENASKPVKLLPGTDYHMAAYAGSPTVELPAEVYCGWAAALIDRGVDGLYFFNLAYSNPLNPKSSLYDMLCNGFAPKYLQQVRRRYPITYPDWGKPDKPISCQLPCVTNQESKFTIHVGKRLEGDGYVSLFVGIRGSGDLGRVMLPATLNGVPAMRSFTYAGRTEYFSPRAWRYIQYIFPSEALRDNENEVKIGACRTAYHIEWVELQINPSDVPVYYDI